MKRKIYPPTYFLIVLVTQVFIGIMLPLKKIISFPAGYFGIIFIFFGIVMNIWADFVFKKCGTTVKPDEKPCVLVESGPFRLSRHPMYLGMVCMLLGTAILIGSLSAFIFSAIFFLIVRYKYIVEEEKKMENEFGQLYLDYKKKTRMLI